MNRHCIVVDGRWTGVSLAGEFDSSQAPRGAALLQGEPRDLLDAGVMLPPPPPPPSDWVAAWTWDAEALRYVPTPSVLALEQKARDDRDRLLAATDWIVARSVERGEPVPPAWREYRQALRDITSAAGWPTDHTWPVPPTGA